jgi:hypothetical protein
MTKYEHEMAMQQEREKRTANINAIKADLEECRNLLAVIPHFTKGTFQQGQDWHFVHEKLQWLEEMLADEQKAYKDTFKAREEDGEEFARIIAHGD